MRERNSPEFYKKFALVTNFPPVAVSIFAKNHEKSPDIHCHKVRNIDEKNKDKTFGMMFSYRVV